MAQQKKGKKYLSIRWLAHIQYLIIFISLFSFPFYRKKKK